MASQGMLAGRSRGGSMGALGATAWAGNWSCSNHPLAGQADELCQSELMRSSHIDHSKLSCSFPGLHQSQASKKELLVILSDTRWKVGHVFGGLFGHESRCVRSSDMRDDKHGLGIAPTLKISSNDACHNQF